MNANPNQRRIVIAAEKITKNGIDQALAEGKTHVKFKNKGVQKRMLKEQEKIRRKQQVRENQTQALNKAKKNAKGTRPVGGGIGLIRSIKDSAHFIDKDGKKIPVSSKVAQEVIKELETEDDEIDLTGASGPEYRYLQQDEAEAEATQAAGFKMVSPFEGMGVVAVVEGEQGDIGTCGIGLLPLNDYEQSGLDLNRHPDLRGGEGVEVIITGIDAMLPHQTTAFADSVLAEHSLSPFEICARDGKTTMFQPGLADKVTETGKEVLGKLAGDFDKADAAEFGLTEMEVSPEAIAAAEKLIMPV